MWIRALYIQALVFELPSTTANSIRQTSISIKTFLILVSPAYIDRCPSNSVYSWNRNTVFIFAILSRLCPFYSGGLLEQPRHRCHCYRELANQLSDIAFSTIPRGALLRNTVYSRVPWVVEVFVNEFLIWNCDNFSALTR